LYALLDERIRLPNSAAVPEEIRQLKLQFAMIPFAQGRPGHRSGTRELTLSPLSYVVCIR
jgi:hypothetical protein